MQVLLPLWGHPSRPVINAASNCCGGLAVGELFGKPGRKMFPASLPDGVTVVRIRDCPTATSRGFSTTWPGSRGSRPRIRRTNDRADACGANTQEPGDRSPGRDQPGGHRLDARREKSESILQDVILIG